MGCPPGRGAEAPHRSGGRALTAIYERTRPATADWGLASLLVDLFHRRVRYAYHEAGHSVVARGCGIAVRRVSIAPDEHTAGRATLGPGSNGVGHASRIMVSWAGPLAEERALGLGRPGLAEHLERGQLATFQHLRRDEHVYSDMQAMLDISEDPEWFRPRTSTAWRHYLRCRTLDLLELPAVWAQVEAVAVALWERQELSGRRFREICRQVELAR
jgi:hypothetical protein